MGRRRVTAPPAPNSGVCRHAERENRQVRRERVARGSPRSAALHGANDLAPWKLNGDRDGRKSGCWNDDATQSATDDCSLTSRTARSVSSTAEKAGKKKKSNEMLSRSVGVLSQVAPQVDTFFFLSLSLPPSVCRSLSLSVASSTESASV